MRRFWFGVSLVLVFMFAALSSYIFFTLTGGVPEVDEAYQAASEVDVGYVAPCIGADTIIEVREAYSCGYMAERELIGGGEFSGRSLDDLAAAGWAVAQIGENCWELSREYAELCPIERDMRLMLATERGVAVYAGTAEHRGAMLLEMPLDLSELPPDMNTALYNGGYQLASEGELDQLMESLDELIRSE